MTKRHTASLTQPSVQNHFPRTRPSRTRTRSLSRCIKTIATLATLGTLGTFAAVPRVALAESAVTLYGRLDNGIEYIHGIASGTNASADRWRGQSGDWGTSMLGLKGIEDLGAGQVVLFHLEQGLNTANGTVGGDGGFKRWASVGLQNKTFGTLSAGRMLWISNGIWDFDPFVQEAWSSASLVRGRNWPQTSNNIRYESRPWYGFDVELRLALGNQTHFNEGTPGHYGRSTGAQLTYTASAFQLRGIVDELRDANGRFSDLFMYSREYTAAANLRIGNFTVQGAYTHLQAGDTPGNGAPTAADYEWLGVSYPFTSVLAMTVGAYHINANGNPAQGGGAATMIEIGGTYALSKRTFLYLTAAQVQNAPNAVYSLVSTPANAGDAPLPGHAQSGFYLGMSHTF